MNAVRHNQPALELSAVPLDSLGEGYRRYRLADPPAEQAMQQSLARWGQLAPVVVCVRGEHWQVVDGFKRLAAARLLGWPTLLARRLETDDERTVKAALYGLNRIGRHLQELEEAWLVQALVREDGLTQAEAAELLGRHKSWACRRLALLEKLSAEVRGELEVGLVSPSLARQLLRLPAGNQMTLLQTARREALTAAEVQGVADLYLSAAGQAQQEYLLAQPREALRQAQARPLWQHDPRLSRPGNQAARQLGRLLEELGRWLAWLRRPGLLQLQRGDGPLLLPLLEQLVQQAQSAGQETEGCCRQLRDS
jgi:ParB family transcriptional regulator, chromosome partitioning protein